MRIVILLKVILSDSSIQTHTTRTPLCRVVPVESAHESNTEVFSYDKEKYREMILDAAETVLGYFGFDRTVYGNKKNTGGRKWRWLHDLRQERERDIRTEMV